MALRAIASAISTNSNLNSLSNLDKSGFLIRRSDGNVVADGVAPRFIPSRFFASGSPTTTPLVLTANRVYAAPFEISCESALESMAVFCVFAGSASIRFALYEAISDEASPNYGLPGTALVASIGVPLAANAIVQQKFAGNVLDVGKRYYFAVMVSATASLRRSGGEGALGYADGSETGDAAQCVYVDAPSFAFPAPFGTPAGYLSPAQSPSIFVRAE